TNGNLLTISSTAGPGLWSLNGTSAYYNGGNVGIGTSTPAERLTIAGVPSYNNGLKLTGNSSGGTGMSLENTSGGGHKYALVSGASGNGVGAGGFGIWDDNVAAYRFAISSSGNVGIGTALPQAALDVSGDARLSGALKLGAGLDSWLLQGASDGFGSIG